MTDRTRPRASQVRAHPKSATASPELQLRRLTSDVLQELKRPDVIPSVVVLQALAQAWALGAGRVPEGTASKTPRR